MGETHRPGCNQGPLTSSSAGAFLSDMIVAGISLGQSVVPQAAEVSSSHTDQPTPPKYHW